MPKMVQFGEFLKNWNSVTRQVNFNRIKLVEKAKIEKFKWEILGILFDTDT